VVLDRGLDVRSLLRLDELALEKRDFLGVVELDDVGGTRRRARDQRRDDEHVRVPLEREAGEVGGPQRAVRGRLAVELLEAGLVPLAINRRARTAERGLRLDDLHRMLV